jgi:hypothetical protein
LGWPGGLASREDWSQARQALERVIQLSPKLTPAPNQLSRVYAHLGLNFEAKQEAQQIPALEDAQCNEALNIQRKRATSFQPPPAAIRCRDRELTAIRSARAAKHFGWKPSTIKGIDRHGLSRKP